MHDDFAQVIIQIKELHDEEKILRLDIARIRKERAALKTKYSLPVEEGRPGWVSRMPREFWYPSYHAGNLLAKTSLAKDAAYCPPDLDDWFRKGTLRDAMVNTGIVIAIVIGVLQLLFVIF